MSFRKYGGTQYSATQNIVKSNINTANKSNYNNRINFNLYNLYKFIYPYKYKEILGFSFQNLIKITERENYEETKIEQFKSNISPFFIRIKNKF